MKIIDRTPFTASVQRTMDGRNIFSGGNPHARRNPARIDAIILHQTTFFSSSISRFDCVIANYVVMQDGTVLFVRPLEVALNSVGTDYRGIDIEFVGDYADAETIRRSPTPCPKPAQIASGRDLIRYLKSRHRTPHVFAHAQFANKNCPGPHFWYNLGEWAVRNGFSAGGRGRPVPRGWVDPSLAIAGVPL